MLVQLMSICRLYLNVHGVGLYVHVIVNLAASVMLTWIISK